MDNNFMFLWVYREEELRVQRTIESQFKELKEKLAVQDVTIAEQNATIAEQNTAIAERDTTITELDEEIQRLRAQIKALTKQTTK